MRRTEPPPNGPPQSAPSWRALWASSSLALCGLIACGGPETTVNKLNPDIAVAPEAVEFGDVVVLYSDSQLVQVVNAGRATLKITSITIEDNDDTSFSVTPTEVEIPADESVPIEVGFAPATYLGYERNLVIQSNDPDTPALSVPLTGAGVNGPVPDIFVDKGSLDFGTVPVGGSEALYFTIENVGDGDLSITSTEQTGSGAFSLVAYPDGQTLSAEGGLFTAIVEYEPQSEAGDSGSLIIASTDPDEPEVEILFIGNGGGDYEYPVAAIDCPDSVDPPVIIDLDGMASTDPEGYTPLTYQWTVVERPVGSASEVADATLSYTSMNIDLAGDYEVQLTVTNTMGVTSAPARCQFEAEPDDSLHVEMYWNTGDSDIDLHLIQDGYGFFEKPGDCCYCNKNPNWGEIGSADDPDLALDNRTGLGPENIRLESPADGNYYVKVHYFDDKGGGTSTATVRIWIDGVLEDTVSEVLTHNDVWDVGYITWPEGNFIEQANDVDAASKRGCY